jgi:hypothetical protein
VVVQSYSRDLFMFIYLLICLAASLTSLRKHTTTSTSVDYLNRHQTEEWKGWMQVRPWLVLRRLHIRAADAAAPVLVLGLCGT